MDILDKMKFLLNKDNETINKCMDLLLVELLNYSEIQVIIDDFTVEINYLVKIVNKIKNEKSNDRKIHFITSFIKSMGAPKFNKYNDINLNRWQEYEDILLDSLWIINERDNSGEHKGDYWGNFIPQIPNQLMRRYTKEGDWILDPFLGSGTTLIEAKKNNRNAVGVELNSNILEVAKNRVNMTKGSTFSHFLNGDSKTIDFLEYFKTKNIPQINLAIFHPPYWNIIHFSEDIRDLSNTKCLDEFLSDLEKVILNTKKILSPNAFCSIVIGDKYQNGEQIPLGFLCMNLFLKNGFTLKSTVVKNFNETKGKNNQKNLWKYRALQGGFYIFKHEYIFIFQIKK